MYKSLSLLALPKIVSTTEYSCIGIFLPSLYGKKLMEAIQFSIKRERKKRYYIFLRFAQERR